MSPDHDAPSAFAQPLDLSGLAPSLYAQGTEEAILERLMARIAPVSRYCVDIGAGDGLRNSNTALLLREQGWQGTLVEGSGYRYGRLQAHYGGAGNVRLRQAQVQPDTVQAVLAEAGVPREFDLLSIDIDGNDYWIWRALRDFRPRLAVIEYNPYYTPPERWVMRFNPEHAWDGSTYYGASLESLYRLGAATTWAITRFSCGATCIRCSASPTTAPPCCSGPPCTSCATWATTLFLPAIRTATGRPRRSE
jgi:hypothetical protein